MTRHRMSLTEWRAWRRLHYSCGAPRAEGELSWLLDQLLSTKRGAIAVLRTDRRNAKWRRPQHTPPPIKDACYLHAAYGRKRGKS